MLLAIDIGNSLIKFGLFDKKKLVDKFSVATKRDYRFDEFHFDRLQFSDGKILKVDRVMVSTVVPELIDVVREASQTQFKVTPTFIDHNANFGFKINYDPPTSAGIDRLINATAAIQKYGMPVIICSFGTATVIDLVNNKGEFLGGIIAPGMKTMSESLHRMTSQLPAVEIEKPSRLIGNSTSTAIRSGVFYGQISMVEGLIKGFLEVQNQKAGNKKPADVQAGTFVLHPPTVVATGGFAKLIATQVKSIDVVDENLTLEGLRLLAEDQT